MTTETRYRTETRTDSEGNSYTVQVPSTWYICTVTLENFDLSHVPVYIMDEDQLSMYALYMSTLGNRPDLFPSSGYVGKYSENQMCIRDRQRLCENQVCHPDHRGGEPGGGAGPVRPH